MRARQDERSLCRGSIGSEGKVVTNLKLHSACGGAGEGLGFKTAFLRTILNPPRKRERDVAFFSMR